MSQLINQNAAVHPEAVPPASGPRALSALTKVTLLALLGTALANTVYIVLFAVLLHHFFLPAVLISSIAPLLAAGLVATRWRWTPALGALLVLLISTLFFSQPLLQYYITYPAYRPAFFLPPHKGHHLRMVRVGATPEPLGLKGVSGWDNLASRDTGTDRRPQARSALDGEHSGEIFDPLLHREQT